MSNESAVFKSSYSEGNAQGETGALHPERRSSSRQILYLYREIMPYNIPVLKKLVDHGYSVTVVQDTSRKKTPFQPPDMDGVAYYRLDQFDAKQFQVFALDMNPALAFIVDRTVPLYNRTGILLQKKLNIPVVLGIDTQWQGGRQWANALTAAFRHQRYYSHALVAGARQFVYANRLGFSYDRILMPLYSADTKKFLKARLEPASFRGPRNFLFVGRFVPVKGIDVLLEAWKRVEDRQGATLTLVGQGPLKDRFPQTEHVIVKDFLSQDELVSLAETSACFVLPSVFEPWALVIHEFATAGLPLIATHTCGATVPFLINNYNGYVVPPGNAEALSAALQKVIHAPAEDLYRFGRRSRELSSKISPDLVATALLSVLND